MLLTTKARDKDIEQLALGYLEDTWNAAIEAAALVCTDEYIAEKIRTLKNDV